MATEDESRAEQVRNPQVRQERREWSGTAFAVVLAAMVVIAVLLHLAVAGLWTAFNKRSEAQDRNATMSWTQIPQPPNRLPPEPRLQPDPVGDLHQLRQAEDQVLETYGWVDRNAGVVRIPVARAMHIVAERGLPSWPAMQPGAPVPPPAPATGGPAAK